MFKVSPARLQTFVDMPKCVLEDRVQYSRVLIPNVFCDGHLQLISCVGIFRQVYRDFLNTLYLPNKCMLLLLLLLLLISICVIFFIRNIFSLIYIPHEDQFFCISYSPRILCPLWESKSQEIIFRFRECLSFLRYQPCGVFVHI